MKKLFIAILFATSVLVMPYAAKAEAIVRTQDDSGYGYQFDDDPLNAGGFGPNDSLIKVRLRAPMATLIRPRTSFIPEILKSIEEL